MKLVPIPIAKAGLATEFAQADQPLEYARTFTNRFINLLGGAEKRPGLEVIGNSYDVAPSNINALHEQVNNSNSTIFASGTDVSGDGRIWRYSTTASAFFAIPKTISPDNWVLSTERLRSVNMNGKLIMVNGDNRNFYVDFNVQTSAYSLKELQPLVEMGRMGTGTSAGRMTDTAITNWIAATYVRTNDLLYNVTKNAYAIITSAGASALDTTRIDTSAQGLGQIVTAAVTAQESGDYYEIYDLIALNVFDTPVGKDNVAVAGTGTLANVIAVSGTNFAATQVRRGDFIYNSTKNSVVRVEAEPTANLVVTSANTSALDSLIFLKKAMPIASNAHVHYKRLYLVDDREKTRVWVSGPDDPQDFTTETQTLDAVSIDYSGQQPESEEIVKLGTFQRFLVAAGKRNVYVTEGIDPVQDTSAAVTDLAPVAVFPQGCVSVDGLANLGQNEVFAANDGMRTFSLSSILAVTTTNISEQIKTELKDAIKSKQDSPGEVQIVHYPRRNWIMFKVGDVIYNFNYTGTLSQDQNQAGGSWTKFTGVFPQCDAYLLRQNGDLLCADSTHVYNFDNGNYHDAGTTYRTAYRTGWMDEGAEGYIKDGRYITAYFENYTQVPYTISVFTEFNNTAVDSVVVTAAGAGSIGNMIIGQSNIGQSSVFADKLPLRWRGEHIAFSFEAQTSGGPDTISKFTLHGSLFGRAT